MKSNQISLEEQGTHNIENVGVCLHTFWKASSTKTCSSSVLHLFPRTLDLGALSQSPSFKCHPGCNSQMYISRADLPQNYRLLFLMVCLTSPLAHFILHMPNTELNFPLKLFHLQPSPSQLVATPRLPIVHTRNL